jgi:hypothetical protein
LLWSKSQSDSTPRPELLLIEAQGASRTGQSQEGTWFARSPPRLGAWMTAGSWQRSLVRKADGLSGCQDCQDIETACQERRSGAALPLALPTENRRAGRGPHQERAVTGIPLLTLHFCPHPRGGLLRCLPGCPLPTAVRPLASLTWKTWKKTSSQSMSSFQNCAIRACGSRCRSGRNKAPLYRKDGWLSRISECCCLSQIRRLAHIILLVLVLLLLMSLPQTWPQGTSPLCSWPLKAVAVPDPPRHRSHRLFLCPPS